MIRIGILGDIGSGKSHIAKKFGYPVFDADLEVSKLYKTNKKIFNNLKKILPKYFGSFPIDKKEVSHAILDISIFFKAKIIDETTPPAPSIKAFLPRTSYFVSSMLFSNPIISVL